MPNVPRTISVLLSHGSEVDGGRNDSREPLHVVRITGIPRRTGKRVLNPDHSSVYTLNNTFNENDDYNTVYNFGIVHPVIEFSRLDADNFAVRVPSRCENPKCQLETRR